MLEMRVTRARFLHFGDVHKVQKRWKDDCGHSEESYVGSVVNGDRLADTKIVDVYVYESSDGQAHVCIRHGSLPWGYCSCGTVLDFLSHASADRTYYQQAAALIVHEFKFFCRKKGAKSRWVRPAGRS